MSLPNRLKGARMTNDTLGVDIDNKVAEIEQALCDIFGFTIDSDVTESPLGCDNAGRITKALLRLKAAGPLGIRFYDSTAASECRLVYEAGYLSVSKNTGTEAAPTWVGVYSLAVATGVVTFGAIPEGPASDPTTANQFTRKAWVDAQNGAQDTAISGKVSKTGDESVAGIKTFSSIPVLPASDPTTANQATRKSYVDGLTGPLPVALLQYKQNSGVDGGTATQGTWYTYPLNLELEDDGNFVSGTLPGFVLAAGRYLIDISAVFYNTNSSRIRLWNVTGGYEDAISDSCYITASGTARIQRTISLGAPTTFRVDYRVSNTMNTDGLGHASGFGTEVYGVVHIIKLS